MSPDALRQLFHDLLSPNAAQRESARTIWLGMDEEAANWLVAEYYAGVSERMGIVLLDILGEIGGWEALTLLREVYRGVDVRPALREAACRALLHNRNNLDSAELNVLLQYRSGANKENGM